MPLRASKPSPARDDTLSMLERCACLPNHTKCTLLSRVSTHFLCRAYTDHNYSDLRLLAREEYSLHCVLVCTRSEVLKAAVQYNTMNSTAHGDSPYPTIDLREDDHWAVDCMVQYFYLQDYTFPAKGKEASTPDALSPWPHRLLVHTRVFALAEQYRIASLKTVALEKFTDEVRDACRLPEFADAVHEVYNSTPDGVPELRNVVVETLYSRSFELKSREDIKTVFLKNPKLGLDYYTRR